MSVGKHVKWIDTVGLECPVSTRMVLFVKSVAVPLAISATLAAMAGPASATERCQNEAIRAEQGAAGLALPDCRAYEMVS
ncbi:MAG TPA: hypothetical protein VMS02_04805, partial [Solirubrobacteraceae bacterium]|nr:hypothetical protein [Solirubrobacteraceae bacterium]